MHQGWVKIAVLFMAVPLIPSQSWAATAALYRENTAITRFTQSYRLYHQLSVQFSPRMANTIGGKYRLTYSLGPQAVDLQYSYTSRRWGDLWVPPTDTEVTNDASNEQLLTNPSQLSLPRSPDDRWTQSSFQVGYSYRGRLFPLEAKAWMQTARCALGVSSFKDQANALSFRGIDLNTEVNFGYLLSSQILIGPTIGYQFGWMYLSGNPALNANRLPYTNLYADLSASFQL